MVTKEEVLGIIGRTSYLDWEFHLGDMGNGFYVQVQFNAPDSETGKVERQHCRKWYISKHMTETEIVDTLYKAVEAAVIHEMKENFTYNGSMIHNPHTSVGARMEACTQTEHRAPPKGVAEATANAIDASRKSFLIDWANVKYVSEKERAQSFPADRVTFVADLTSKLEEAGVEYQKTKSPKSIKELLDKAREQMKANEDIRHYGLGSDEFLVKRVEDPICDDCLCERSLEKEKK